MIHGMTVTLHKRIETGRDALNNPIYQWYDAEQVDDVLVGEVWLASGQSNMEMPLRGFWNCPVEESAQTIALSGQYRDKIRYLTIEKQECFTLHLNYEL